jgi:hypothetical protein
MTQLPCAKRSRTKPAAELLVSEVAIELMVQAVEGDRGNGDRRREGERRLGVGVVGCAGGLPEPVPVGVDDDLDVVHGPARLAVRGGRVQLAYGG